MVPQFIDVEDKITPFLTMKQFFMLVGAGAIAAMFYPFLETTPWLVLSAIIFGVISAFAFVKIHGRDFGIVFLAGFKFLWNPHLYIYRKEVTTQKREKVAIQEKAEEILDKNSPERLRQIARLLDAKENHK
ncbi:MAG: hypothetical protein AAB611_00120 [Patescibacteria group bacterium]